MLLACASLEPTGLVVGLCANALFGWWWADPLAALAIAGVAVKEGRESWRGKGCAEARVRRDLGAQPESLVGFDRGDDSFELEACAPAGLGDSFRCGGLVGDEAGLVAGDEDDAQEAERVAVSGEVVGCRAGPGGRFGGAARACARQVELGEVVRHAG